MINGSYFLILIVIGCYFCLGQIGLFRESLVWFLEFELVKNIVKFLWVEFKFNLSVVFCFGNSL